LISAGTIPRSSVAASGDGGCTEKKSRSTSGAGGLGGAMFPTEKFPRGSGIVPGLPRGRKAISRRTTCSNMFATTGLIPSGKKAAAATGRVEGTCESGEGEFVPRALMGMLDRAPRTGKSGPGL
jgi:hypothetical protein